MGTLSYLALTHQLVNIELPRFSAHLSHRLAVNYCDHRMISVSHSSVHQHLIQRTSPKPMGGLSPNLTGMTIGWFPFQKFLFLSEFCLPWQQKGGKILCIYRENLENLLVKNYLCNYLKLRSSCYTVYHMASHLEVI